MQTFWANDQRAARFRMVLTTARRCRAQPAQAPPKQGPMGGARKEATMFLYRVRLFRLFGFDVHVDASWLLLAVLIAWSLAIGVFPSVVPGLARATYWWMGIAATLGLLFSIVFHEMSHSLVARRFNLPISGITLFIFGGVAEMESEPTSPRAEFLMALAGPVASVVLGLLLFLLFNLVASADGPPAVAGILWYLGYQNWVLAIFNLVPAFPLDGGRMLRAALWGWRGDPTWATRTAARAGNAFGILLIVLGLINAIRGDFVVGLWSFLIGMFLRGAADAAYRQTVARQILGGQPVSRFMNQQPIAVMPHASIRELVEDFVYRYHHKMFPVVRNGQLVGCVSTAQLGLIDRSQWDQRTIADVMERCSADNIIRPDTDALEAMSKMQRTGRSRLLVVRDGQLVGILSLRDLLDFLALKLELQGGGRQGIRQTQAG
jgi:Zn-dependent protease